MPAPKFNFIPERQLGDTPTASEGWIVTLLSNNVLYFPREMANILEMSGKYFRFFADIERKAIGWLEIEDKTTLEILNDGRLASPNSESGAIIFSVGRILKRLGYVNKGKIKLQVKTYTSPLVKGTISYVIIPSKEYDPKEKETTVSNEAQKGS